MTITFMADTTDGRVLYRADWMDGKKKATTFVCVSRAFFEARAKDKGWVV